MSLKILLAIAIGVLICSVVLVIWILIDMRINPGTYVCSMDEEIENK